MGPASRQHVFSHQQITDCLEPRAWDRGYQLNRITTRQIRNWGQSDRKIVMVTCYDATFARLLDHTTVDALLVGDSLGMVVQGHQTTLPVTLEDMIYHSRAVARGSTRPHLVGDLPFGTYQGAQDEALMNAARLLKEGGVQAVKLEGGEEYSTLIHRLTTAGIPVMGHLGLTPQSVHQLGGFRVQGKTVTAAEKLKHDAQILQDAGCYALVLEGIPATLAAEVTHTLSIPTIGIGAGAACSGQVLVLYDLLGLDNGFNPKFLKKYANLHDVVVEAMGEFADEVREGTFPALANCHH
ncbi:MAG: 3-methyl-2-oxobutanoate hydroxymethyltransferase [Myxococcota bacterium]|nr:3-methyl-2-oxobutanoate hydroxymethyltransferase [Myxococcota bacterium]